MTLETSFLKADIECLEVGMTASYSQTITEADIAIFSGVSGDKNPVHMDDDYASQSRYKKRIAHGMFSASFFSGIFGTRLPGAGCVYASQTLSFVRPVYVGDTVTARVTVKEVDLKTRRIKFQTSCKVRKKTAIDGEAEIYIPKSRN